MDYTIDNVKYKCYPYNRPRKKKESIKPIGIDTEAFITGECFMIATSLGDIFQPDCFPACMFTREYRGKSFVAYNLKYDMGAFLQAIPRVRLNVLRSRGWCFYKGFHYVAISNKCLTIRKGKNAIHLYDMLNFYHMSLNNAAKRYLNEEKDDLETKGFWPFYVFQMWDKIGRYCVRDALLVEQLAKILIHRFERYGVFPQKLYSVAYISYTYFRQNTNYVTVKRYWQKEKEVIRYAMEAYNGGKFEVTEKGTGYYYEYDIVSAYPFEISNLADISWARVEFDKKYRKNALYGFLRCKIDIPFNCYSPIVMKRKWLNCYPVGQFERTITKNEYDYLIEHGADITIISAYWLFLDNRQYPYKRSINRLVKLKSKYKEKDEELDYETIKILMNSLYGKFVQLIDKGGYYAAGSNWNPIFGAIITANVRCRMSTLQSQVSSCVAIHTDSIITTEKLENYNTGSFGELTFETEGQGVILGSGIYQIGDKIKFRGFPLKKPLLELCRQGGKVLRVQNKHAYTWREVVFRGWENSLINRFETIEKKVDINFDQKRLWLDDWTSFKEIEKRNIQSIPLIYSPLIFQ